MSLVHPEPKAPAGLGVVQSRVRIAARALARHGLVHAYGHCSERIDAGSFLVCAAKPMGLIGVGEPGVVVAIDGPLPDGVLGEVRIHQQVYRLRPDVRAVVRAMPPAVMALGTARRVPRPRHGMGSYFGAGIALWDDPQLLRDDDAAAALAHELGERPRDRVGRARRRPVPGARHAPGPHFREDVGFPGGRRSGVAGHRAMTAAAPSRP